ncbi:MAG TPA: hypothetical protein VH249_04185 [Xanthobacteraceae bacterium]|jgi:hypothetical protein|nr:hypothetical protein [Xanthobacteraceae bacterium]
MNKLITTTARKTLSRSFAALLAVAAMTAVTASAAKAWDQQATEAQMDNELNYGVTGGYGHSAHARHPSGPYASARSPAHFRGIDPAAPSWQRDFQLEGR